MTTKAKKSGRTSATSDIEGSVSASDTQLYLLERLGGEDALEVVVEDFYQRLLGDPHLARFFEGIKMARLKRHQRGFLKVAFTKIPESIDVPMLLLKKHERLFSEAGLNESHFDMVAAHLMESMRSLGVKQHLIDEAIGIVAPLRGVFEAGAVTGKEKKAKMIQVFQPNEYKFDRPDAGLVSALLRTLRHATKVQFIRIMTVDLCNSIRCKVLPLDQCNEDGSILVCLAKAVLAALPTYGDTVVAATGLDATDSVVIQPDLSTLRVLPYAPKSAVVFGTAHDQPATTLSQFCTRGLLSRIIETAKVNHDLVFSVGAELEFCLHDAKTGEPLDESVFATTLALNAHDNFISTVCDQLKEQEIVVNLLHSESAPGQLELVLQHQPDPLLVADQVVLAKETIMTVARQFGHKALFLPKIHPTQAGNGLHYHLSFEGTNNGNNNGATNLNNSSSNMSAANGSKRNGIHLNGENGSTSKLSTSSSGSGDAAIAFAKEGLGFVEGILQHLPALLAVTMPTTNSFRRVGKGCWTGHEVGWAIEDKEAPLRLCRDPLNGGTLTNVEYKLSDATANPYLSLACILACGLNGMAQKYKLRSALSNGGGGDALPVTLGQALTHLTKDKFLMESVMGTDLSRAYVALRRSEVEHADRMTLEEEVEQALRRC